MKKCAKTKHEPSCLKDFRSQNPNGDWKQFRNEQPSCYTTVRDTLRCDQREICAYCEIELTDKNEQVAHFHPKSDTSTGHNWALDWDNLWLACKGGSQTWMKKRRHYCPPLPENLSCDEKKGNAVLDDQVLTPGDIPAFPRIFRFEQFPNNMIICPDENACERAGICVKKVEQTIEKFGLNCPRLARARLSLHRQIEQALKKLRTTNCADPEQALSHLARHHLGPTSAGTWCPFFTLVRWRLGKIAESYLRLINFNG